MSATGQQPPPLARGGARIAERGPAQYLPSEHSEHQYEGLFKGVGVTSKEPICSKRSNSLSKLHMATHFAVGCKKWDDEGARGASTTHITFTDPEVVYATRDAPDKNASIVDFRQREHVPEVHYRTEQRERFDDPGPPDRQDAFPLATSKVHFGDDTREFVTSTGNAHFTKADAEAQRAAKFRMAGCGTLVPTSVWPKPPRVHPITAGPRSLEPQDYGIAAGMQFGRISGNRSTICMDHNVRDPIRGVHYPTESWSTPHVPTTREIVDRANQEVPPLRSIGALRPPGY